MQEQEETNIAYIEVQVADYFPQCTIDPNLKVVFNYMVGKIHEILAQQSALEVKIQKIDERLANCESNLVNVREDSAISGECSFFMYIYTVFFI